MPGDLHVEINKHDLARLKASFERAPRVIRGQIKKEWKKAGKATIAKMKSSHFKAGTGAHTLGVDRAAAKKRGAMELFKALRIKKVAFGKGGRFGGYMVYGTVGAHGEKRKAHPLLNIYEHNTGKERFTKKGASRGRLQTTSPFHSAFEAHKGEADLVKSTDRGIVAGLKKADLT